MFSISEIPQQVLDLVIEIQQKEDRPMTTAELIEARRGTAGWKAIDRLEVMLKDAPAPDFKYEHIFTPVEGCDDLCLYTRQIFMPACTVLTTGIHLFEHPYTVSWGRCWIWDIENGWTHHFNGESGITKAGTRRVLWIPDCGGCIFVTQHVTKRDDPDVIRARITFPHLQLGHLAEIPAVKHRLTK